MVSIVRVDEFLIGIGLVIIALLIYKRGSKRGLLWSNYFAFGTAILSIGHFLKAIVPAPLTYPVDAPARYTGLIIILYAMLKEVDHPRIDLLTGLGILNGLAYTEGAMLYSLLKGTALLILSIVPQCMFLVIGPLVGAAILLRIYTSTKDFLSLLFALGFIVYAIASVVLITSIYFVAYGIRRVDACDAGGGRGNRPNGLICANDPKG